MQPLTAENLLPLEEFASRWGELFHAQRRYVDRYRHVRLGPSLALVFQNRQTLWYHLQCVLHTARLTEPARVRQELALYNRLLPPRDRLQAALLITVRDRANLREELAPWQELRGDQLALHVGPLRCPANLLTCRPEDRCVGAAHWVQFYLDDDARALLADGRQPAHLAITLPHYTHDSGPLGDDVRASLFDDLGIVGPGGVNALGGRAVLATARPWS